MIITDKFVFLHFPKTGGLFVAGALKKLSERSGGRCTCRELLLPNLKRIDGAGVNNVHGTCEQIPAEDRPKPIVSCIRNPFDRYVSTYEFRNWVQQPARFLPEIKERFPRFPDLTFAEYVEFINIYDIRSRTDHELLTADIGMISYAFIQFFARDPRRAIRELGEADLGLAAVTFLRTEDLNRQLYEYLQKMDYNDEDIRFILAEERSNATPARQGKAGWRQYYDRKLYEQVRQKESLLFKLFPEYDQPLT
ncbi:MAG: hypothetical protein WC529_07115 [Candidatus Margulisiibacteriota bacterium]